MRKLALALLILPGPAMAQDLLSIGVGGTDIVRNTKSAAEVRLEYRPALSILPFMEPYAALRPWVGVEATTRGSVWAGGGVLLDLNFGRFAFVPQVGVGGYERGSGRNLGSALEFRTGVEVAYKFADQSRVALGFSHMSNAGIAKRNPGTEAVVFSYQLPIGSLFGR